MELTVLAIQAISGPRSGGMIHVLQEALQSVEQIKVGRNLGVLF